jgi:membrane-associated protease RseP (regulator of RpoE activity)
MHRLLLLLALLSIPAWPAMAQTEGRAWVGVTVIDASPSPGAESGAKTAGALVLGVEDGGPGATSGMRLGDHILAVDAEAVGNTRDLVCAIQARKPGDTVRFTLLRLGKRESLAATLGRWPPLLRGLPPPPPADCRGSAISGNARPRRHSWRAPDCKGGCFATMQVA